jgi:hypothetical protein
MKSILLAGVSAVVLDGAFFVIFWSTLSPGDGQLTFWTSIMRFMYLCFLHPGVLLGRQIFGDTDGAYYFAFLPAMIEFFVLAWLAIAVYKRAFAPHAR